MDVDPSQGIAEEVCMALEEMEIVGVDDVETVLKV